MIAAYFINLKASILFSPHVELLLLNKMDAFRLIKYAAIIEINKSASPEDNKATCQHKF
jgi:hypothetical protein